MEKLPLNNEKTWKRSNTKNPSGPWLQKPFQATLSGLDTEALQAANSDKPNYNSTDDNYNNIDTEFDLIERHLTVFDLVSIGVGGTIGSGIFVLCGFIAHQFAGPATCISWAIAGAAACLSGICYAELACRMPAAGSSYVYVYASMGELPAVLVAACLTLEYGISASAVARSWGDKCFEWMNKDLGFDYSAFAGNTFNPLAALIATASVLLLMGGVKESKSVTNFFTVTKICVVIFMSVIGVILMQPGQNLTPFVPPQFGFAGILRGATSSFFGYIGFDEVCCVAGEAINPQRNMPLAIVLSLAIVTFLYILAALALTGMVPFDQISEVSGFPVAFEDRGWTWASQISAFGEIFTLPIVVLISLMAQPRLQYALAIDGLLPKVFAKIDESGNLRHGTLISGIVIVLVASFVPFAHLNDMISAGILVAFCMTDSALVIMRHESPADDQGKVEKNLGIFNALCLVFGISLTHFHDSIQGNVLTALSTVGLIYSLKQLNDCPKAVLFGGTIRASQYKGSVDMRVDSYFKTPLMPFVPCLGIFINWYLISQLDLFGIGLLLGYLAAATAFYFSYGIKHSVGANGGWEQYEPARRASITSSVAVSQDEFFRRSWALPPAIVSNPYQRRSSSVQYSSLRSSTKLPPQIHQMLLELSEE